MLDYLRPWTDCYKIDLKSMNDRNYRQLGGVVENITYRDLKLNNTRQAFEFNMGWRMVPPIAPAAKVLPVVKNDWSLMEYW